MNTNQRLKELIENQKTMTLATISTCFAWSAPVYYVYANHHFYFFSSPESRHIKEALTSGHASASIFADSQNWHDIRGIQMSGSVGLVKAKKEAVAAISLYVKKFQFVKTLFPAIAGKDMPTIFKQAHVRLYRFHPETVFYTDNTNGFGHRHAINIAPLF